MTFPIAEGAARPGCQPSIAALIVTYNRKALLRANLLALQGQTRPLDEIIVVNNGSTDGTGEMLKDDFPSVTVLEVADNPGFSASVAMGLQEGVSHRHHWIWVMDDDAIPVNTSLKSLCTSMDKLAGRRFCLYSAYVETTGQFFAEPIVVLDNASEMRESAFREIRQRQPGGLVEGKGGPFLGILIPKEVCEIVGFPRPETFIWGDFEYLERVRRHGFRIFYDLNSILHHPRAQWIEWKLPTGLFSGNASLWKRYGIPVAPLWKYYYGIRNIVDFKMRACGHPTPVAAAKAMTVGLILSLMVLGASERKSTAAKFCLLAMIDGLRGKMGKRFTPDTHGHAR